MSKEYKNDIVFGRFINYMDKALKHKRLDYIKHKKYLESIEMIAYDEECVVSSVFDDAMYSSIFFMERKENITEKQWIILKKYYLEHKKLKEIANELGCTVNAVKVSKYKAIKILRKNMEK